MEPLADLKSGLEILEPFLKRYGFEFDNYENGKGSGGQFTIATFKKGRKKFIIGYRFSIGELSYQFDNFKVGHIFYLDHLGFSDKKQFPGFQSDDKLKEKDYKEVLEIYNMVERKGLFSDFDKKTIEYCKRQI